jgi:hypothetical protein
MPSFPSPNPPKNRYHMLAKHSPACLTHLGHSFVSESYKASSGKALERTNTSSPSQSDLGTEETITAENKDKPLVFPLLG